MDKQPRKQSAARPGKFDITKIGRQSVWDGRWAGVIEMTPEQWAKVPANPRQRDTEKRSRRAKHLRTPHFIHATVYAALLPDGSLVKLDAHTRDYNWSRDIVEAPPILHVILYRVRDIDEATELYMTLDSPEAVDNITDLLFGVSQELKISFQSDFLNEYHFASGLEIAQQFYYGYEIRSRAKFVGWVKDWTSELMLLDKCSPTKERFVAPVLAGALLLLRGGGEKAVPFLDAYQHNRGSKGEGRMDAIQALYDFVEKVRLKKQFWGSAARSTIVHTMVSIYLAYEADRDFPVSGLGGPRALPDKAFRNWIAKARSIH